METDALPNAYLLLKGCVRIYERSSFGRSQNQLYYKEDLFPGEMIGEGNLTGNQTRLTEAHTLSPVDLIQIDYNEFMKVQGRETAGILSIDRKLQFLREVPLFKSWDDYLVQRVANASVQKEINKGVILTNGSDSSNHTHSYSSDASLDDLSVGSYSVVSESSASNHSAFSPPPPHAAGMMMFIMNGKVDVVTNLKERNLVASLYRYDYVNEAEIINSFARDAGEKVHDRYTAIAVTNLEVLTVPAGSFHQLFNHLQVEGLKNAFLSKQQFRAENVSHLLHLSHSGGGGGGGGRTSPPRSGSKYTGPSRIPSPFTSNSRSNSLTSEVSRSRVSSPPSISRRGSDNNNNKNSSSTVPIINEPLSRSKSSNTLSSPKNTRVDSAVTSPGLLPSSSDAHISNTPQKMSLMDFKRLNEVSMPFTDRDPSGEPVARPERVGLPSVDNMNLINYHYKVSAAASAAAKKVTSDTGRGDSFYIKYLLSSPKTKSPVGDKEKSRQQLKILTSTGSVTSRVVPKDASHSQVEKRPNTAKAAMDTVGTFPLVNRQSALRKYVKPLREMRVLPSIVALEEKIGQRHISSILDNNWQEEFSALPPPDILRLGLFEENANVLPSTVSSTSTSSKEINIIGPHIRLMNNTLSLPEEDENSQQSSPPFPQTPPPVKSATLSKRNEEVSYQGKRTGRSSVGRGHKYSASSHRVRDELKPPSLELFFKPVVHPDGVFSTPLIDLSSLPTASSSINTFLSSLHRESNNRESRG